MLGLWGTWTSSPCLLESDLHHETIIVGLVTREYPLHLAGGSLQHPFLAILPAHHRA